MRRLVAIIFATLVAGCGVSSGDGFAELSSPTSTPVAARRGTLIADGCSLDPWQEHVLAADSTAKVIQEVVFLCALPLPDGQVNPTDDSGRAAFAAQVKALSSRYTVHLGVSFTDGSGYRYDGEKTATELADDKWRATTIASLRLFVATVGVSGVQLDFQKLPSRARAGLNLFAGELRAALVGQQIGLMLPPPDVAEGFDVPTLAKHVDRVRSMTLDFSDPGAGPVADPGWMVDTYRTVRAACGPTVAMDLAYPLFGTDVGPKGGRNVTYHEALGLAFFHRATPARGPTGALSFAWTDSAGGPHQTWYDDSQSTLWAMRALDDAKVPGDVGIVFYGFGAEDPETFPLLARARR